MLAPWLKANEPAAVKTKPEDKTASPDKLMEPLALFV